MNFFAKPFFLSLSLASFLVIVHAETGANAPDTFAAPASAISASGPTPFPTDAKDWPGKGVIRVFGWMTDNRKAFWLERERKQGSVVFAGDSLIGGWSGLARDLPGLPVANRGIGGEVTRGLLFRFKEDVLDLHPRAIVLLSGTNDLSALQDVQQTRSNLVEVLDRAERSSPGVPIVLCTLPPRNQPKAPVDPKRLIELNSLIKSAAQGRAHVVVLDLYALLADPDGTPHAEYFAADKLHISPAGYKVFGDALAPLFKQFKRD
ncbi:MAG: GDSL-type esterase/lipase family protein [Burkholderiaceae bacterium]|nr:GDSL-type esterase/lipase family protein [Burkholderiaceae bacterium]